MVVSKVSKANVTMVWLFASMRAGMHLQLFRTGETFATTLHGTFIRFLPSMGSHMDHQLSRLYEGFLTNGTLVRPFACMDAHMAMQLAGMFKGTAANLTFIRPLLRMNTSMYLQILFNTKQFMTEFAFKRTFTCVRSVMTYL